MALKGSNCSNSTYTVSWVNTVSQTWVSVSVQPTLSSLTTQNLVYQLHWDASGTLFLPSLLPGALYNLVSLPHSHYEHCQTHLVSPKFRAILHYSQSVCLLISETCCCRTACLLHYSPEPKYLVLIVDRHSTVNNSQCRLHSLLLLSAVSLSHYLKVNAVLCIIQLQSIFKLEREMEKQMENVEQKDKD